MDEYLMLDEIGAFALELGVLLRVNVQDHVPRHGARHLPRFRLQC